MNSVCEIDFPASQICEKLIISLQAIREDFPAGTVQSQLNKMVEEARQYVASEQGADLQLEKLLDLFYQQWGFCAAEGIYKLSETLWLDSVLCTRRGTAISLGVILLHIASQLEIPLMPVIFPTQFILRADWLDEEKWLINPFNGETLDEHTLDAWLKGNISPHTCLYEEDLYEAEVMTVVCRMLDMLKVALMEEKCMELALKVSQAILQLNPDDPYEIRDRGLIYARLDCEHIALHDLTYFVENCPEDPASEIIRQQIHSIEHKRVTLH